MDTKLDLKSLSYAQVCALAEELGFPAFRARQIFAWCGRGVTDFSGMTDLNKADRAALQEKTYLSPCKIADKFVSKLDGTAKYLIELQNGYTVEAVVMRYRFGLSACLSTQAGCRMGCAFCASTLNGLGRNLSAGEILDQYLLLSRDQGERIGSVVLMGMGEPLDNYDNVVRFLENIAHPAGAGLSHRHITLSTCGLADRIRDLARLRLQITLAVSLHAPNDEIRDEIVPINKKYNIETFLAAVRRYLEKSNANQGRVTIEYVMLDHVNDGTEHAHQLAELLKDTPCKINLIPWNPFPGAPYGRSSNSRIDRFSKVLMSYGFTTIVRKTRGDDIDAACGQLAGDVIDRTKRTLRKRMQGEAIDIKAV